jgi:hypothetical protein
MNIFKSQGGHAHFALFAIAVVAIVGAVGFKVYGDQQNVKLSSGVLQADQSSTAAATASTNGYLVINNELDGENKPKYTEVQIYLASGEIKDTAAFFKTHKCGGKFTEKNKYTITKKLKGTKALKISCSAIGAESSYQVKYVGSESNLIGVDIDSGFCTMVHPDASKIRKAKLESGKCAKATDEPKKDVSIRVLPGLKNKKIGGFVEVRVPNPENSANNLPVAKTDCTGQVRVSINVEGVEKAHSVYPLKYVGGSKASKGAYCIAKINSRGIGGFKLQDNTLYLLKADFKGNASFNAASGEADKAYDWMGKAKE